MENNLDHIFVFKTNIGKLTENCSLHNAFETNAQIRQWSVDHEDTDCVLRVVSETLTSQDITGIVSQYGYDCSELD